MTTRRSDGAARDAAAAAGAGGAGVIGWGLVLLLGFAALGLGGAVFGLRQDLRYLSFAERLTVPVLLMALFAATTGALFLWRGPWRGRAVAVLMAVALAGAVGAALAMPGLHQLHLWINARCLVQGILVALAPLAGGVLALGRVERRRAAPEAVDGPRLRGVLGGAALGASCGLVGVAALHRQCALGDASHTLLFHAGAAFFTAALGAAIARAMRRPPVP